MILEQIKSLFHRAYGLSISLRKREKLRLYKNYELREDAVERTNKEANLVKLVGSFFSINHFKCQPYKMVKHTQAIRQIV